LNAEEKKDKKLSDIVIKEFKIKDTLQEVIRKLNELVKDNNVEINLKEPKVHDATVAVPPEDEVDPFAEEPEDEIEKVESQEERKFTFEFINMPLPEVLKYICISSNMKFQIKDRKILISEPRMINHPPPLRFYPLTKQLAQSPKEFFEKLGLKINPKDYEVLPEYDLLMVQSEITFHRLIEETLATTLEHHFMMRKAEQLIESKKFSMAETLLNLIEKEIPKNKNLSLLKQKLIKGKALQK